MKTDISKWVRAALIRAVRTFAEAMLAYIGTGALVLGDVNWLAALSAGLMGAVTAILIALAGLPEVPKAVTPTVTDYREWREDLDGGNGEDVHRPEG